MTVAAQRSKKAPVAMGQQTPVRQGWTFFTNRSHVLMCLAREPDVRLCDVAKRVGITERTVQRIVADLEKSAILTRVRNGRRNRYQIHVGQALLHPIEAPCTVGDLLNIMETD